MENQQNINNNQVPQHSYYQFTQPREPRIFFNSNFDSGNMSKVVKVNYDNYSIWTASDAQGTDNEGYPKSWFYFQVGGFNNRKINFSIHRVHFLYAMCKRVEMYRPVFRVKTQSGQQSQWDRLPYSPLSLAINNNQELVLKFDYYFPKSISSVQFAFIYPYSYEQCRKDIRQLSEKYKDDQQIFFQQYQLCQSYQKRTVDFVVISSHEGKEGTQIIREISPDQKIVKFRSNKPIIFVSSRVHPIQTPSSYCMNGIIKFLLNKKDMRAFLLRRYFVFVLVPMLNPDGVARGHCRMDALNQNLNRYYLTPDAQKQPSCFAVKKLCQHYNKDKRLFMYLDLHAHPAYKGNFTFGNAIYQFIQQVESQLFPKVLSQNCINFQFQQCIFSRKHMKAKDRNEDISKQGCGRVVFYKQFGLVHSYTLQCGYHLNTFNNELEPEKNTENKYIVKYKLNDRGQKIYENSQKILDSEKLQKYINEMCLKEDQKSKYFSVFQYTQDELDNKQNQYYKRQLPIYNQQTFYNLGRNILISILDIWNKNPFTRLSDMNAYRKQIAEKQSKLDRFRKQQTGIKTKQKKIVELIQQQLYGEWHKRNIFNPTKQSQNTNNKKRNQTLQFQKISTLKIQKVYKLQTTTIKNQQIKQSITSQPLIDENNKTKQQKNILTTSQNAIQGRMYYSRNTKFARIKQNPQEKQVVRPLSINKQLIAGQIKLALQQDLLKYNKNEGFSMSSKIIKYHNFNGPNLRVRNMIASNIAGINGSKR